MQRDTRGSRGALFGARDTIELQKGQPLMQEQWVHRGARGASLCHRGARIL